MEVYFDKNFHNNNEPENFFIRFLKYLVSFVSSSIVFLKNVFFATKKRRVVFIVAVSFLLAWGIHSGNILRSRHKATMPDRVYNVPDPTGHNLKNDDYYVYVPGPISMDKMKKEGCVADGLLSGYGSDTRESVDMVNRSKCAYLHRALETWAAPPDFEKARGIMREIDRPGIIYGMFIAEALKQNAEYFYPDEDRNFDFRDMCAPNSENRWGEHTCIPSFKYKEYRKYVEYITKQAMDLGIQSFMFGQVYYQDDPDDMYIKGVIEDMRAYAKKKGIQIAIGAQTGNIANEKYLKLFDYIEGGAGIGDDGTVESGACWSRLAGCWALLWNDQYRTRANNVLIHLDWSGLKFDDMSSFARMDKDKRDATLKNLYSYFTSKDVGFLLPIMATVNKDNGGCYGHKKNFYSASNVHGCKDEDEINGIISRVGG